MSDNFKPITLSDDVGNTMNVAERGGRYYPRFVDAGLQHAMDVKARPDDTIILAYSKSGTHWLYEIIRLLRAGTVDIERVEKDEFMIEAKLPEIIDNAPSPRILNSHYHADDLSPEFISKKCRMFHITRDPRDIAVSDYYHHMDLEGFFDYKGEFKDFLSMFLKGNIEYGSWFEYTKKWEKVFEDNPDIPLLILSYESMKLNPLESIRKINEFMGYKNTEEFFKQVVDKSSIETMKKERNIEGDFLGNLMYRKGIIGDWKNSFTVAQSEMFNEVYEKEMVGTNVYKQYSLKDQEL